MMHFDLATAMLITAGVVIARFLAEAEHRGLFRIERREPRY